MAEAAQRSDGGTDARRNPASLPLAWAELPARPRFRAALALAAGLAGFWFLVASRVSFTTGIGMWGDQYNIYTRLDAALTDPYAGGLYTNVPWGAVIVAPLALLPFEWSVLAQMVVYFALLALLIYRFGGGFWTVVLVLTSSLAYDTALEISLEWIVVIGLLVPPVASGPFLLVKPQAALGAWFGFRWRDILWGGVVVLVVIAVALVIWPGWVEKMLAAVMGNSLGEWGNRVNVAISRLVPRPIAWAIGLGLAYLAFRRKDVVIGVLAWQFFVPYATFYGMMPAFALLAMRWPWAALAISLAAWVPYSRVLLPFLF